jgi:hypothetical protein
VFAIVFRWVEVDLKIVTKVVSVGKYERSFNHQNLVDAIVTSLAKFNLSTGANAPRGDATPGLYSRSITPGSILCWMRDRCAVNEAALHLLLRTHRGSKNMACLSHTLTHPGEKFLLTNLQKFKEDICGLMHQSLAGAAHWVRFGWLLPLTLFSST